MGQLKRKMQILALLWGVLGIPGCWRPPAPVANPNALKPVESRLALKDVLLEEPDEQGKVLWKIKAAEVTYSPDRKLAKATFPKGELFQDGKVVYAFTAQTAEILQDQPRIKLVGNVVVTELKNQVVIKSKVMDWQPKQHLITIPQPLTLDQAKIKASATKGKIFSRDQRAELIGQVVALTTDPAMKLRTDRLNWQMNTQELMTDSLVQVERFEDGKLSDRGQGNYLLAKQQTKTVILEKQAQIQLQAPPLDIQSQSLEWKIGEKKISSPVPVQIHHRIEKITLNALQGWLDLPTQIYHLTGQVHGKGEVQQATFSSQKFTWYIGTNQFLAEGDVLYEQQKPKFASRSPVAKGEFKNQLVVLNGGQERVETEIIPTPATP